MRWFLVDTIDQLVIGDFAIGTKTYADTEPFFQDHFPASFVKTPCCTAGGTGGHARALLPEQHRVGDEGTERPPPKPAPRTAPGTGAGDPFRRARTPR